MAVWCKWAENTNDVSFLSPTRMPDNRRWETHRLKLEAGDLARRDSQCTLLLKCHCLNSSIMKRNEHQNGNFFFHDR